MRQRPALQLPLQPGYLHLRQSRPARRSLRRQPGQALFAPLAPPAFHRPLRDTQRGRDLPVLLASLEASHGLEPEPLSPGPLGVGQAAALRISHPTRTTETTRTLSGEQPDITQSSSVQQDRGNQQRPNLVHGAQFAAALVTVAVQLHHW